jgi:hydrogenase/urease accessory protein HupE
MSVRHLVRLSATLAALAALTVQAAAHPGHASVFGFDAGFLHWLTSVQHGLVMVMVGVAAAVLAGRVSQASGRAALRLGGGAVAALGLVLVLV